MSELASPAIHHRKRTLTGKGEPTNARRSIPDDQTIAPHPPLCQDGCAVSAKHDGEPLVIAWRAILLPEDLLRTQVDDADMVIVPQRGPAAVVRECCPSFCNLWFELWQRT
jgi:hypothetical protein